MKERVAALSELDDEFSNAQLVTSYISRTLLIPNWKSAKSFALSDSSYDMVPKLLKPLRPETIVP